MNDASSALREKSSICPFVLLCGLNSLPRRHEFRHFREHTFLEMSLLGSEASRVRIVSYQHDRFLQLTVESRKYLQNLFAGTRVEVSGWFVRQNQVRIRDDRARDRDALFLTAGQLPRLMMHAVFQTDQVKCGL